MMTTLPSDQALVDRCLSGSNDAWTELVNRHSGRIYSIALKYGLSEEDAAEVLQHVCLQWWQHLDQVRETERLTGWLATVTARSAMRVISMRRLERQHQAPFDDEAEDRLPSTEIPVEEMVLAAERSAGLRRAIDGLDDRCRYLLEALYFSVDPPEYAVLAAELGLAEGSIGALRRRCLRRLRHAIAGPADIECIL